MRKIKAIAYELSKGNIEKASEIRMGAHFGDQSLELEVVEIAQQAVISYIRKGEYDKAHKANELFAMPEELVDEAVKHALLASYYDGNLSRVLEIKNRFTVKMKILDEIVNYCESWGRDEEAKAMKAVFSDQGI